MPDSDVPVSKSPGLLETKLATVDFPTPALPKNMFPVKKPLQEVSTMPRASSKIIDDNPRSPLVK